MKTEKIVILVLADDAWTSDANGRPIHVAPRAVTCTAQDAENMYGLLASVDSGGATLTLDLSDYPTFDEMQNAYPMFQVAPSTLTEMATRILVGSGIIR